MVSLLWGYRRCLIEFFISWFYESLCCSVLRQRIHEVLQLSSTKHHVYSWWLFSVSFVIRMGVLGLPLGSMSVFLLRTFRSFPPLMLWWFWRPQLYLVCIRIRCWLVCHKRVFPHCPVVFGDTGIVSRISFLRYRLLTQRLFPLSWLGLAFEPFGLLTPNFSVFVPVRTAVDSVDWINYYHLLVAPTAAACFVPRFYLAVPGCP